MNQDVVLASERDAPLILQLLRDAGLPTDGVADHLETAFVARDGDAVVGCAAVELYPDGALLRSVAVAPTARSLGLGRKLAEAAITLAQARGIPAVYLLTTTAEHYFPKLGFTVVARETVPGGVQQSVEFRSACPASATVMRLPLRLP
jgi:N-acetylglutamate synthase-like GNAT family acetyltransferase